jgi:hypothetical protein
LLSASSRIVPKDKQSQSLDASAMDEAIPLQRPLPDGTLRVACAVSTKKKTAAA